MTTVNELKQQAQQFRKEKRYQEALSLYRDLWENHREACNEWDGWGYAFCLSKQKQFERALVVCRAVYRVAPEFQLNNNTYAWAIYHTQIAVEQVRDEPTFLKAATAILKLCRQDTPYSPYVRTVLAVAKHFENPFDAPALVRWLTKVDGKKLRDDVFSFTDPQGKRRELASDRERYYGALSKALLALEDYQACIAVCREALDEVAVFHYDNDLWFRWRIALSKYYLGDTHEAIPMLESLLQKRREWFIQHKLAEMYADAGDSEKALAYALDAALNAGDTDKKLKLFGFMAELFAQLGRTEDAKDHLALVYRIRKERNWKISNELYRQMQAFSIAEGDIPAGKNLVRRLRARWNAIKYEGQKQYRGTISTILPNGKAGFVATDDGTSYYFRVKSFNGRRKLLQPGLAVTFYLEDGFDAKKGRATKNAVNLLPIEFASRVLPH